VIRKDEHDVMTVWKWGMRVGEDKKNDQSEVILVQPMNRLKNYTMKFGSFSESTCSSTKNNLKSEVTIEDDYQVGVTNEKDK
jgi:hypothetical protein